MRMASDGAQLHDTGIVSRESGSATRYGVSGIDQVNNGLTRDAPSPERVDQHLVKSVQVAALASRYSGHLLGTPLRLWMPRS